MLPNYTPLHQFSKFNNFLLVCWYLCKNISNFVPPAWKLDNPYHHIHKGNELEMQFSNTWSSWNWAVTLMHRHLWIYQQYLNPHFGFNLGSQLPDDIYSEDKVGESKSFISNLVLSIWRKNNGYLLNLNLQSSSK